MPAGASPRKFSEKDLSSWKRVRRFRAVLEEVLQSGEVAAHRSFADAKRRLPLGDYLSLFLLGLFNPIARTMRGLVQASRLPGVPPRAGDLASQPGQFL